MLEMTYFDFIKAVKQLKVLQKVKYGDLSPEQQELANLLGMDTFLKLVEQCGGTNLYIPKAETIGRTARNTMIQAEFNGCNIKALAAKYRLSEVQIRSIVTKKNNDKS